jgi:hypothetical protein
VLLRAGGGVDHHTLAGPSGADEHRCTLGACEDFERVVLLGTERPADALDYLTDSVIACNLTDISACGLRELGGATFDRLLLRTDRQELDRLVATLPSDGVEGNFDGRVEARRLAKAKAQRAT